MSIKFQTNNPLIEIRRFIICYKTVYYVCKICELSTFKDIAFYFLKFFYLEKNNNAINVFSHIFLSMSIFYRCIINHGSPGFHHLQHLRLFRSFMNHVKDESFLK